MFIRVRVNYSGTVDVQGLLLIDSSSESFPAGLTAGNLTIRNGGTLTSAGDLSVGSDTLVDGATATLTGTARLSSGTLTVQNQGVLSVAGSATVNDAVLLDKSQVSATGLTASQLTVQDGATFTSAGNISVSGSATISGAALDLTGSNGLSTGFLTLSSAGTLAAPGPISVANLTLLDGVNSTLSAALTTQSLTVEGGSSLTSSAIVSVGGSAVIDGSSLTLSGAGQLGTVNLTVKNGSTLSSSSPVLVSAALVVDGSQATASGVTAGSLSVQNGGALFSAGDVVIAGAAEVDGSKLTLTGAAQLDVTGTLNLTAGAILSVPGSVSVGSAIGLDASTATLAAGALAAQLNLGNKAALTTGGPLEVSGDTLIDGSSFTLAPGGRLDTASLTVQHPSSFDLAQGDGINVNGQAEFFGWDGSVFTLDGVFSADAVDAFGGPVNFTDITQIRELTADHATVTFSKDSLDTSFGQMSVFLQDHGTVNVQGSFGVADFVQVDGGGTFNVRGDLTVPPGTFLVIDRGTINVSGRLTLSPSSTLEVGVNDPADVSAAHLNVTGAANLGGTLVVGPGSALLAPGERLPIIAFGSLGRPFQTTLQTQQGLFSLDVGSQAVTLVVNATPAAASGTPFQSLFGQGITVFPLGPVAETTPIPLPGTGAAFNVALTTSQSVQNTTPATPSLAAPAIIPVGTSSGGGQSESGSGQRLGSGSGAETLTIGPFEATPLVPGIQDLALPATGDLFSQADISRSLVLGGRATADFLPGRSGRPGTSAGPVATLLAGEGDSGGPIGQSPAGPGHDDEFPLADCLIGLGSASPSPRPANGGAPAPAGGRAAAGDGAIPRPGPQLEAPENRRPPRSWLRVLALVTASALAGLLAGPRSAASRVATSSRKKHCASPSRLTIL
jgi:hypothetical protein